MNLKTITVHPLFQRFLEDELLPVIGIQADDYANRLTTLVAELTPENRRLLTVRDELQSQIDVWHRANPSRDLFAYRAFLNEIGYLEPAGNAFSIETENVDPEIARIAGPQLVNMRDPHAPLLRNEITRNPFVWAALLVCVGLILLAVNVPAIADVLGVRAIGAAGWLLTLCSSFVPLLAGQCLKVWQKRRYVTTASVAASRPSLNEDPNTRR